MKISGISMTNSNRANSPAMKGLKEDNEALRKLDKFLSKNDLVLRADIYMKADKKNDSCTVQLYTNKYYPDGRGQIPLRYYGNNVEQIGRNLREAKLNLIERYSGKILQAPCDAEKIELKMPEIDL